MSALALTSTLRRRIQVGALISALLGGVIVVGALPGTTGAAHAVDCSTVNTYVWDGSASMYWDNAANWNVGCVPGGRLDPPYNDDVTIPSGSTVVLKNGESAQLAALHNNGALTIAPGAALETYGASTSKTITMQGTLASASTFTVTSSMKWVATGPGKSSTMETRWCQFEDCSSPTTPGVVVINAGATLALTGAGVNLKDQLIVENHGTTKLTGTAYIAADWGTEFRNLRTTGAPVPKFIIANASGGYLQGFLTSPFSISTFANTGLITKTVGSATSPPSVIDANLVQTDTGSPYTGTVQVHAGTLSIFTPGGTTTRTATVQQGAEFSDGGCDGGATPGTCQIQPTSSDQQVTAVELTKTGTTSAAVSIQNVPSVPPVSGQRGVPVQIDTGTAQSDPTHPLHFKLYLDATLLHSGETAAGVANTATVSRQPTTADPYTALPNCGVSQDPTTAVPVCVARTLSVSATTSLGTGDVEIVVSSLLNSRYRVS
jgi:hypothetical protein